MEDPSEKIIQRTRVYWFSDGLAEIGFAIMSLVLSLYFYGYAALTPGSLLYRILDVGFLLILLGAALLTRRLITIIKTRLTYPRTGYVNYHQPKTVHLIGSTLLALLIAAILVTLFSSIDDIDAFMPAASGILIGAALAYFANRYGPLRFYLLAALSSLLGTGLSLFGVGNIYGLSIYYAFMGLGLLISGLLVLRDYLLKTQPLEDS
jgi:ABC-type thiamin/hydroxymethylpyrimidine transport system permease subunit